MVLSLILLCLLAAGCTAPIGATRSPTRTAYAQMEANALSSGKASADTVSLLHRYNLDELFAKDPEEAVRRMHSKAVTTADRDLCFALAEMCYLTGERIGRSIKPWESRDPRDYYLGAAAYAYAFLFGEENAADPTVFDRRYRTACDLYNFGLGLAFSRTKDTNATVELQGGIRRLPVGEIEIRLDLSTFPWPLEDFQQFILADHYLVRGLSVRNRQAGLGAILIASRAREMGAGIRLATPATIFLRFEGSLRQVEGGTTWGVLELHSAFGPGTVQVSGRTLPLETDLSVHIAYGLNQSMAWKLNRLQFLSLYELVPSRVYLSQPYQRGRIPVVFVHGTYSSPVWWAEMLNTLRADPVLRQKYQFWFFIYNSSAPLLVAAGKLRDGISAQLRELDPDGTDDALRQMVVIGHSQGGLLTKLISTDTEDRLWRAISDEPLEEARLSDQQAGKVRRLFFLKRMSCVGRTIFIATPHRGSYRASGFVRSLTRRLVSIPTSLSSRAEEALSLAQQLKLKGIQGRLPTSIDGMSPRNPVLRSLAEIPVAPGVKAHSIIPVKGDGDPKEGSDGVVKYKSAHVDYVESELIINDRHSCQSTPAAIEEVRRILHVHLNSLRSTGVTPLAETQALVQ